MLKLIFLSGLTFFSTIYNIEIKDVNDKTINLTDFMGKKILFVNIATNSPKVTQLASLESLRSQFPDSLVIIALPSNSFGNESRSNSEISSFCQSNYDVHFLLASKNSVSGASIQPIYHWLTVQNENGVMSQSVSGDFQKYLVDEAGNLVGVFAPSIDPMDTKLIEAIRQ